MKKKPTPAVPTVPQNQLTPPTPFELSHLAAQLHPKPGKERAAIRQAMTLWQESERELEQVKDRAVHLNELVHVIYDATPEEWDARIKAYPGERADVDKKLSACVPTDQVKKRLYLDNNYTKENRHTFFLALVKFAKDHGMTPPPTRNWVAWPKVQTMPPDAANKAYVKTYNDSQESQAADTINMMREELAGDTIPLNVVRWAVQARQKQIAINKKRVIPQSSK